MARGLRVLNGSKAVAIGPSAFFDSFTVLSPSIHVKQPRQLLHHRPAQLLGVHDRHRAAVVARHVMPDADRAEFDRRLGFYPFDHLAQMLVEIGAVIDRQGAGRSAARRVGKACVSTCRSRRSPYTEHTKARYDHYIIE